MGENTPYDDYVAATTPANPFSVKTLFAAAPVADTIIMLWRTGARHPQLARQTVQAHPGLPLHVFNTAADLAWRRLTDEERRLALEEADHVD